MHDQATSAMLFHEQSSLQQEQVIRGACVVSLLANGVAMADEAAGCDALAHAGGGVGGGGGEDHHARIPKHLWDVRARFEA